MKKYECLFVIDAGLEAEVTTEVVEKFTNLVKTHATLIEVNNWGKRKLAYEVNKKWDGYYSLISFDGPADFIKELERVLRIDERVMKFLVTKIDEKKIAQANFYALKKKERDAARFARQNAERAAHVSEAPAAAPQPAPSVVEETPIS